MTATTIQGVSAPMFFRHYGCIGLVALVCSTASFAKDVVAIPWVEDARTDRLEAVAVGNLPDGKLNASVLLAYYNRRVREATLPDNCLVVIQVPPETLTEEYFNRDIQNGRFLAEMDLLAPIGISNPNAFRSRIATCNLRQFLWVIYRAFSMNVKYTPTRIVLGYGSMSHNVLTPGQPPEKKNEQRDIGAFPADLPSEPK